jgi:hypothetical protein
MLCYCRISCHRKSRLSDLHLIAPIHLEVVLYYCEELLSPYTTQKSECHFVSAACDYLFNIFTITLHVWESSPSLARGLVMP